MLQDAGFSVERTLERDGAAPITEVVGTLELRRTASATTQLGPRRDFTRLVFVDAIDGEPPANPLRAPSRGQSESHLDAHVLQPSGAKRPAGCRHA